MREECTRKRGGGGGGGALRVCCMSGRGAGSVGMYTAGFRLTKPAEFPTNLTRNPKASLLICLQAKATGAAARGFSRGTAVAQAPEEPSSGRWAPVP